ncbi:hypothetical protein [Roseiflexus castenholzii]|uniref:hypothetical protein n=1 Tax=Roseiflexus castenholzii TaxID=120962 RepID=UPI003C799D15
MEWTWMMAPGAWVAPLALAGVLVAAYGIGMNERVRTSLIGFRAASGTWSIRQRIMVGHIAAAAIIVPLLGVAWNDRDMTLEGAIALGVYLLLGWSIPRRPVVHLQRERRQIRRLLPSFLSYLRVSLSGYDTRPNIFKRYIQRNDRRLIAMQRVLSDALSLMESRRLLPFEALLQVARDRGVAELIDIAQVLAHSERQGSDPLPVLEQSNALLEQIQDDEFRQMIERRKLYLLALGAIAVVAILVQILFVLVIGGRVLERFG